MKKYQLIMILACFMLMSACGINENETDNISKNMNTSSSISSIQELGNMTNTTIEDMVNYFKEMGLSFPKIANIDKIDFAAYEGKILENNGEKAYLYRLNSNDLKMKKLMEQVREKGIASVKIDNEQKQYSAMINKEYLLLYDQGANMSNLTNAFTNFQGEETSSMNTEQNTEQNIEQNIEQNTEQNIEQNTEYTDTQE